MLLKFEAEDKSLKLRPKCPEARGYEVKAKILASRPVWLRGFNISAFPYTTTTYNMFQQSYTHETKLNQSLQCSDRV